MSCFLIVSLRRCGSTFLACELDNHMGIFCQKEFVLRDSDHLKTPHMPIQGENFSFMDAIRNLAHGAPVAGSKLTIPEYSVDKVDFMLDIVRKDKIKVIHLTRPFHELMISLITAKRTGIWHKSEIMNQVACPEWLQGEVSSQNDATLESFDITVEEIENFCQKADWIDRRMASLSQSNPYMHVGYDEIAARLPDILQFILPENTQNIPLRLRNTSLERVISIPHEQLIANWEAVAPLFQKLEQARDYRFHSSTTTITT